ncbi:ADP-ribosylglycohydrolase family protein [Erythrobacter sp.]|uniref:ADP-ribosylglycohydrolase family protein n=1 Tax=Erythrobacter sp. TaxID=1042 RepID=UPI001425C84B|nr:ADP-ribosylglycohydrolase family protein [Erythrobacter sp.]QIQ86081.1 MAG: ADP-ribosylglycohydrolase family protein [Erythrobacter sp.]
MTELTSRARGALLGLAVGDAVGTTLEFRPRDSAPPLTDMVGGGPFGLAAGTWTDDTAMALALAESIVECGFLDLDDLMRRFVSWWREGAYSPTGDCFDIGITTRDALARYERSGDPLAGSSHPRSAGNGSLMRLSPVAIRGAMSDAATMREAARRQSATTHAADACLDACEGWAVLLRETIHGAGFDEALEAARALGFDDPVGTVFAGNWRDKDRSQIESSGYVIHSLEAALWCNAQGGDYREIILLAANLGEDADTTAAIAGQLAGARFGLEGIPEEWLARVAWRERLLAAADGLVAPGAV